MIHSSETWFSLRWKGTFLTLLIISDDVALLKETNTFSKSDPITFVPKSTSGNWEFVGLRMKVHTKRTTKPQRHRKPAQGAKTHVQYDLITT